MAFNPAAFAKAAARTTSGKDNGVVPAIAGKYLIKVAALKESYSKGGEWLVAEGAFTHGPDKAVIGKRCTVMLRLDSEAKFEEGDAEKIKSMVSALLGYDLPSLEPLSEEQQKDKAARKAWQAKAEEFGLAQREIMAALITEFKVTDDYELSKGDPVEGLEAGGLAEDLVLGVRYYEKRDKATKKGTGEISAWPFTFTPELKTGLSRSQENPHEALDKDGEALPLSEAVDFDRY